MPVIASVLLSALLLAGQTPTRIEEISHAIGSGRLDQARSMIAAMIEKGESGDAIERLLADLDDASGHCKRAVPRYLELFRRLPADATLAEAAAVSALRCGRVADAERLIAAALSQPDASWRAWNAKGVLSDLKGQWDEADAAYTTAISLRPNSAQVANNRGWSLLLRGRWSDAVQELDRAVQLDPASDRANANLELARSALLAGLPPRKQGEDSKDWAARLNDAGVIAQLAGDRKKAIAAFSQAIEARTSWFERASNNLQLSEALR